MSINIDQGKDAAPSLHGNRRRKPLASHCSTRISWARDAASLREAQSLRYEVFAREQGAQLQTPVPGLDVDEFDDFCDHVLVRDAASGQLLGTCRLLSPSAARRCGRSYAESEFDLLALKALRPRMLEMGRTCVRRDHRSGAVLLGLWRAVAAQMQALRLDLLLGCTSLSLADGGVTAQRLSQSIMPRQWVAPAWQARPLRPLRLGLESTGPDAVAPSTATSCPGLALLQSYLRFGAKLCAAPAWDPAFDVADFLMLLDLNEMSARHRRHFLPHGLDAVAMPAMAKELS